MGKLTTPEEVAKAIVMLCNPEADWLTGNVIGIDGGEYNVSYTGDIICKPIK